MKVQRQWVLDDIYKKYSKVYERFLDIFKNLSSFAY
jgi:hypothetical protein